MEEDVRNNDQPEKTKTLYTSLEHYKELHEQTKQHLRTVSSLEVNAVQKTNELLIENKKLNSIIRDQLKVKNRLKSEIAQQEQQATTIYRQVEKMSSSNDSMFDRYSDKSSNSIIRLNLSEVDSNVGNSNDAFTLCFNPSSRYMFREKSGESMDTFMPCNKKSYSAHSRFGDSMDTFGVGNKIIFNSKSGESMDTFKKESRTMPRARSGHSIESCRECSRIVFHSPSGDKMTSFLPGSRCPSHSQSCEVFQTFPPEKRNLYCARSGEVFRTTNPDKGDLFNARSGDLSQTLTTPDKSCSFRAKSGSSMYTSTPTDKNFLYVNSPETTTRFKRKINFNRKNDSLFDICTKDSVDSYKRTSKKNASNYYKSGSFNTINEMRAKNNKQTPRGSWTQGRQRIEHEGGSANRASIDTVSQNNSCIKRTYTSDSSHSTDTISQEDNCMKRKYTSDSNDSFTQIHSRNNYDELLQNDINTSANSIDNPSCPLNECLDPKCKSAVSTDTASRCNKCNGWSRDNLIGNKSETINQISDGFHCNKTHSNRKDNSNSSLDVLLSEDEKSNDSFTKIVSQTAISRLATVSRNKMAHSGESEFSYSDRSSVDSMEPREDNTNSDNSIECRVHAYKNQASSSPDVLLKVSDKLSESSNEKACTDQETSSVDVSTKELDVSSAGGKVEASYEHQNTSINTPVNIFVQNSDGSDERSIHGVSELKASTSVDMFLKNLKSNNSYEGKSVDSFMQWFGCASDTFGAMPHTSSSAYAFYKESKSNASVPIEHIHNNTPSRNSEIVKDKNESVTGIDEFSRNNNTSHYDLDRASSSRDNKKVDVPSIHVVEEEEQVQRYMSEKEDKSENDGQSKNEVENKSRGKNESMTTSLLTKHLDKIMNDLDIGAPVGQIDLGRALQSIPSINLDSDKTESVTITPDTMKSDNKFDDVDGYLLSPDSELHFDRNFKKDVNKLTSSDLIKTTNQQSVSSISRDTEFNINIALSDNSCIGSELNFDFDKIIAAVKKDPKKLTTEEIKGEKIGTDKNIYLAVNNCKINGSEREMTHNISRDLSRNKVTKQVSHHASTDEIIQNLRETIKSLNEELTEKKKELFQIRTERDGLLTRVNVVETTFHALTDQRYNDNIYMRDALTRVKDSMKSSRQLLVNTIEQKNCLKEILDHVNTNIYEYTER